MDLPAEATDQTSTPMSQAQNVLQPQSERPEYSPYFNMQQFQAPLPNFPFGLQHEAVPQPLNSPPSDTVITGKRKQVEDVVEESTDGSSAHKKQKASANPQDISDSSKARSATGQVHVADNTPVSTNNSHSHFMLSLRMTNDQNRT